MSFTPWTGNNYESPINKLSGIRLLVLGESHYRDDPSSEAFSQDPCWEPYMNEHGEENLTSFVVKRWGQDLPFATYTKVANVLLNLYGGPRNAQNREIWDHVAFYNYVSTLVPKGDRPTDEQWQNSILPFDEVLNDKEPNAVLMLGKELTERVVNNHGHEEEYEQLFTPYEHNNINYLGIYHPSAFRWFSYDDANPAFQDLLTETIPHID